MKTKHNLKTAISTMLAVIMMFGMIPMISVSAAQKGEYEDPADNWLKTNSRTNEMDINATVTYETQWCKACNMDTSAMTYRVPEYTKSGTTALNRGVKFSDGTCLDGKSKGNLDMGTPGVDAYFTGYHWTKSICGNCGIMNTVDGQTGYNYNKNVYTLNGCDHSFFLEFDNTTYEEFDEHQHTTILKKGEYCQFCKGTFARAISKKEQHSLEKTLDAQLSNNRFYIQEKCSDCEYETSEYAAAKAVVASYYGEADGKAHTVKVSDLSDDTVHTRIRYGTNASNCNLTSAPNYTEAGYYPVYYEIDYKFEDESMTENGVSYVWLLDGKSSDNNSSAPHVHDYRYLETVKPTCAELGYERWQCDGCGKLLKQNYTQALEHSYKTMVIREATCTNGGTELEICTRCGDFHENTTPALNHNYEIEVVPSTCTEAGYTKYTCINCGNSYVTNVTDTTNHKFNKIVKKPTCTEGGYTTYFCTNCHTSFTDDYTDALGHKWDKGHTVTNSTCEAEGVIEFHCENCNEKMIKAESAKGHKPGTKATCTEPQRCEVCGTVLEMPTGHNYKTEVIKPTCTAMGYTTYNCKNCNDSYVADYTDKATHDYKKSVTAPTCTEHGFTTYSCKNCDDEYISDYTEKLNHNYKSEVTEPTCTTMGYTTYSCADCGDTHKSEYIEALGHKPSDWIIDTAATIEHAGEKHIECTVCNEVLQREIIAQLIDKDNSDEDGNAKIGDYSIILTDKDGKPVFNSEITIDENDNVTIKLPNGRLLDYADQTTITALYTDTQKPKSGLQIFIFDENNNAATGKTDADGQLKVPNDKSSTGDNNGTIGKEDEATKTTFVVTVTDKTNAVIPNCDVYIGESNNLVVDLPEGVKPTKEYPVIITVTDQNGKPQTDITVIALGSADYIEKGKTDIYGKVTLPIANDGYTDDDGKVNVQQSEP